MNKFQYLGHCPICNTQYQESQSSIISKEGDTFTVYVECGNCKSSVIVVVTGEAKGLVTIAGMLTDLTHDDIASLRNTAPLTIDDVLEMHTHLKRITKIKER